MPTAENDECLCDLPLADCHGFLIVKAQASPEQTDAGKIFSKYWVAVRWTQVCQQPQHIQQLPAGLRQVRADAMPTLKHADTTVVQLPVSVKTLKPTHADYACEQFLSTWPQTA
jgi:hypothetical protein